mmetsp:Transcript_4673/g.6201  ORF Transcript_4673/g.6201 Transcript_4673/m.6201 type:complete len:108 (-) Transcript_4673:1501-1824(-)
MVLGQCAFSISFERVINFQENFFGPQGSSNRLPLHKIFKRSGSANVKTQRFHRSAQATRATEAAQKISYDHRRCRFGIRLHGPAITAPTSNTIMHIQCGMMAFVIPG